MRPVADARARLRCSVAAIDTILSDCLGAAEAAMSPAGVDAWLDGASKVCGLGRGTELVLLFLEGMPEVVRLTDESVLAETAAMAERLSRSQCGPAINPFLSTLPAVARRLESAESLRRWFALVARMTEAGREGLIPLLQQVPALLAELTIDGLANWIAFGLHAYRGEQSYLQPAFFGLRTADAHAAFQRERHGTLFVDHQRQLDLCLRALWDVETRWRPFSSALESGHRRAPHIDKLGLHVPDVLDDRDGVAGIDRYRAMVAHMAAHKRWSRPYLADNFSPFQHLAVEAFEDARVEALAMRRYPGLRRLWLSLHPTPRPGACPDGYSPIRHALTMLSRALLDPAHPYTEPRLLDYVARFHARMAADPENPRLSAELGVAYLRDIHTPAFHSARVWFEDTVVDYRDDNRWLWHFLEDAKGDDQFHSDHGTPDPVEEQGGVPPSFYDEWDYQTRAWRPDWATVHEGAAPPGDSADIDRLLARHCRLAAQLERLVDRLKPQQRKRVRHQREGDEIDFDALTRAVVDARAGSQPDGRVYQRHVPDRRDIAVLLLLDLSQSIAAPAEGGEGTLLGLSQEAATLLAWAVDRLGDALAIAGFSSETRHLVRYQHFKDFGEPWGPLPKARLAAMAAGASTRMGAALRHAGSRLAGRPEEKKLILLLSDGEPSDVDVEDPHYLKWDAHAAVGELRAKGVTTFCVTLDAKADSYVGDIFGRNGYAVVDRVQRLPEKLTRLFMALTA